MYKEYYGFTGEPFATTPSLDRFFESQAHSGALNFLLAGVRSAEPFLLVSGDYGTGKTLLCLRLLDLLNREQDTDPRRILSFLGSFDYEKLLRRLLMALGVTEQDLPREERMLQDRLDARWQEVGDVQQPLHVIIDEAQELDGATLNKMRLLMNSALVGGCCPLRVYFFAHGSFLETLRQPAMAPLWQRIKRKYQLTALSIAETEEYIYYHLVKAGGRDRPRWTQEALAQVYRLTQGVPRLINNICDACLIVAASGRLNTIDGELVVQAAGQENGPGQMAKAANPQPFQAMGGAQGPSGSPAYQRGPLSQPPDSVIMGAAQPQQRPPVLPPSAGRGLPQGQAAVGGPPPLRPARPATPHVLETDSTWRRMKRLLIWGLVLLCLLLLGVQLYRAADRGWLDQIYQMFSPGKSGSAGKAPVRSGTNDAAPHRPVGQAVGMSTMPQVGAARSWQISLDKLEQRSAEQGRLSGDESPVQDKIDWNSVDGGQPYTLRVGSFLNYENALQQMQLLHEKKPQFVKEYVDPLGTVWWRVYYGCFISKEEALEAKTQASLVTARVERYPGDKLLLVVDGKQQESFTAQGGKQYTVIHRDDAKKLTWYRIHTADKKADEQL